MGVELRLNVVEAGPSAGPVIRPGPPRLPFVLSVGVTGHRADVLPAGSVDALRSRIRQVLLLVAEAGRDLLEKEQDCFASLPPRLRFVSPIADGVKSRPFEERSMRVNVYSLY